MRSGGCRSIRSIARRASRRRRCSPTLTCSSSICRTSARIYTYIYTLANCLRAARAHGKRVVVCDRPNPIGGEAVEGAALDAAYASFVGQFPIPMRHGLTIGEAARLFNEQFGLNAALDVIPMQGWTRS